MKTLRALVVVRREYGFRRFVWSYGGLRGAWRQLQWVAAGL